MVKALFRQQRYDDMMSRYQGVQLTKCIRIPMHLYSIRMRRCIVMAFTGLTNLNKARVQTCLSMCSYLARAYPYTCAAELLAYLNVVTKNQSEKTMTKIVDFVSGCPNMDFLER